MSHLATSMGKAAPPHPWTECDGVHLYCEHLEDGRGDQKFRVILGYVATLSPAWVPQILSQKEKREKEDEQLSDH